MNTQNNWVITATILDPERLALWRDVFPGGVVPIVSIIPQKVVVPEHGELLAYMLDLGALSERELDGVISVIAKRFGIPIDEVRSEIHSGVPILAEDVSVSTRDQGLFFSMIGDSEEDDE